ncbi:ABC transporter permease [Paenibacillus agricola]|uniref:ABC transporter permease n=1 Tax=Paenibacillus agricola TaxID=2716264 RepID=A0ABX0JI39_9BACL|nr:ABC transporter permease [Paenibacillus agricola]NHN34074.1 ABC transporter permease [Paenibacillus agricola]
MSIDVARTEIEIGRPKVKAKTSLLLKKIWRNQLILSGLIIVIGFIAMALILPSFVPYSPFANDYTMALKPPSLSHLFGTDNLGRDVFSRVVWGARESLASGIVIVTLAFLIGVPLGLISGFYGGWLDEIFMRIVDTWLAFPGLVLTMAIAFIMGPSFINASFAVAVIMAPQFIRITRGQVLSIRDREFVLAARSHGVPTWRILLRHILPNASTSLTVASNLNMGHAIMVVASLSYLGLGTPPPYPSWGEMLQSGTNFLTMSPWISFAPGLAIFLLVLGFTLLGEGIRDEFDPQSKIKV